jgi:hypothetical protein
VTASPPRYLIDTYLDKKKTFLGMDVSVKDGGRQVEYEDQDPSIHGMYVDELGTHGIAPRMDQFRVPASAAKRPAETRC